VPLSLTTQFGVDMSFTSAEMALSIDDFSDRILKPAIAVVANKKVFDGLKPEYQTAIKAEMKKAVDAQRIAAAKADVDALAELQKLGMQYDEMPASEIAKMREMTAGVVEEIKKRVGADLVNAVLAEVAKAGGS